MFSPSVSGWLLAAGVRPFPKGVPLLLRSGAASYRPALRTTCAPLLAPLGATCAPLLTRVPVVVVAVWASTSDTVSIVAGIAKLKAAVIPEGKMSLDARSFPI